jgi:hypothetical protein
MFMRETTDRGECRMFGAGLRHQEFATGAVARIPPHPAVEALAIVPEDVEAIIHNVKTLPSSRIA